MWVLFAFGSAFFAGITAILAKVGIRNTDSDTATAIRTVVVLLFSWLMAWLSGSVGQLSSVSAKTWLFLALSGLATGASWLCYFRALQLGDVNKVTPIDKSSTVLTMLLAFLFLGESLTWLKAAAMVLIGAGAYLMIQRKREAVPAAEKGKPRKNPAWLLYALGSAVFASLTAILGKIGIEGVNSTLGTAIRTGVVLVMAWAIVFGRGKQKTIRQIDGRSYLFLILSGFATGGSWLCYYRALQTGPASVVVPIDKLSILVSVLFARIAFNERLTIKAGAGLAMIVAGTLLLLL
ncbi:MAG TPA: EamA family transporter [Candidatus Limiplasma sp.]|nr:EamA family transporter [Candidatus Limiplasma sp.]HPR77790.1 EamA family transporter [Candidatus Limiplasma sp.]